MEPSPQPTSPAIPIAIISGFAMIALAIFFTNKNESAPLAITQTDAGTGLTASDTPRPVGPYDYIQGNPNAPILMVEYSDYDCPFCKEYHDTMNKIMDEYGVSGKVAWVYRQFPIADLHPNAPKISEAALCVGSLGGNKAFWEFTDMIFQKRSVDEPTNVTRLVEYAEEAGVSKTDYISCVDDKQMETEVLKHIQDGVNAGARGTPYTVLIVGNQKAEINGAQSHSTVRGIVQNLVDQLDGEIDINEIPVATETIE